MAGVGLPVLMLPCWQEWIRMNDALGGQYLVNLDHLHLTIYIIIIYLYNYVTIFLRESKAWFYETVPIFVLGDDDSV